jgi:hypothetical protein
MTVNSDNIRYILGLKLKQWRLRHGYTLKELAARTGLSFSYLSEIEKGKKYPKPEKLLQIANALGIPFDEIVSSKMEADLDAVSTLLDSPFIREFPFRLFGIAPREVLDLITNSPQESGAFIRTLAELGKAYDVRLERFLFAALRAYQKLNHNYFPDLEDAAAAFMGEHRLRGGPPIPVEALESILVRKYGYLLDETQITADHDLRVFRSIWIDGTPPRLFLNGKLLPSQKAFILGREIGYQYLNLKTRATTSSWLKIESFEQVLNNFKASYFSGALMIDQHLLRRDCERLFQRPRWDGEALLAVMRRYEVTPEIFLYRLSELLPKFFGLEEMFYLRFHHEAGTEKFSLTKELNLSRVTVPHGVGLNEHYCRRWPGLRLLQEMGSTRKKAKELTATAERLHFIESDTEFFTITLARPLALADKTNASITLGFLIDDTLKKAVRFWNDPALRPVEVNETCERCRLSAEECSVRAAPPVLFRKQQKQEKREEALEAFLSSMQQARPPLP